MSAGEYEYKEPTSSEGYAKLNLPMPVGDICKEYREAKSTVKQIPILADLNHTAAAAIAWLVLLGGETPCRYHTRRFAGKVKEDSINAIIESPSGQQAIRHWRDFHPEISEDEYRMRIYKELEAAYKDAVKKSKREPAEVDMSLITALDDSIAATSEVRRPQEEPLAEMTLTTEVIADIPNEPTETTTEATETTTADEPINTKEIETMSEFNDNMIEVKKDEPKVLVLDTDEADSILCYFSQTLLRFIKEECDSLTDMAELVKLYDKIKKFDDEVNS